MGVDRRTFMTLSALTLAGGLFAGKQSKEIRSDTKQRYESFLLDQHKERSLHQATEVVVKQLLSSNTELTMVDLINLIAKSTDPKKNNIERFTDLITIAGTIFYDKWTSTQVKNLFGIIIPKDQTSNYLMWSRSPDGFYNSLPKSPSKLDRLDHLKHFFSTALYAISFYNTAENQLPVFVPEDIAPLLPMKKKGWKGLNRLPRSFYFALKLSTLYEFATTFTMAGIGLKGDIKSGILDPDYDRDIHFNQLGANFAVNCIKDLGSMNLNQALEKNPIDIS